MKYRSLSKWKQTSQTVNLLYFAQMLDELFFEYSLDTYKPSAMNSSLLCEEATEVIDEIEKGNIQKPNLQHILDELCENLARDPVSQSLLTIQLDQINANLKNPKVDHEEKRLVVNLIRREINLKAYKEENENQLKSAIRAETDFKKIRTLTRSYATTLVNLGFSFEFISETVLSFFHYGDGEISGNESIDDFLQIFSAKSCEMTVVFQVSKTAWHYKDSFKDLNLKIIEKLSDLDATIPDNEIKAESGYLLVAIENIKARDVYSARRAGKAVLETISSAFSVYNHKEQLKWLDKSFIVDTKSKEFFHSDSDTNPMFKCQDKKPVVAAKFANKFLNNFGLASNSFDIFTRTIELHALALRSDSKENQILNLWIALESIIPANHDKDTSNIEHIITSVIPFLNLIYYQRLLSRFTKDLLNWNRRVVMGVLKDVDATDTVTKLGKIMALKIYEPNRLKLSKSFKDFHLMADRFEYLCQIFSSPQSMYTGLNSHEKRIGWQIRRIYRARNLIVHSGLTPSYTEVLIENLHDYLDTITHRIIDLAIKPKKIVSIGEAFKLTSMTYEQLGKKLKDKQSVFTDEYIEKMFAR